MGPHSKGRNYVISLSGSLTSNERTECCKTEGMSGKGTKRRCRGKRTECRKNGRLVARPQIHHPDNPKNSTHFCPWSLYSATATGTPPTPQGGSGGTAMCPAQHGRYKRYMCCRAPSSAREGSATRKDKKPAVQRVVPRGHLRNRRRQPHVRCGALHPSNASPACN